jgi:glutathione peroxidase
MKLFVIVPSILLAAGMVAWTAQPAAPAPSEPKPAEPKPSEPTDPYVLGFTMKDIDGKDQNLEQYKGKVVMIVNVASRCGYTPQYKSLQKLYDEKKDKGFVILAFPANNFRGQEPGSDADIKQFCTDQYKVTFPLFSKISVKGEDQHPLYKKLSGQPKPIGGDPQWNFQKFIVDRQGNVVARFDPKTDPMDTTLVKRIDDLLAAKPAAEPETKP